MNNKILQRLLAAARQEPPPVPPAAFAAGVLRAIRREVSAAPGERPSVWAHLNSLFPRLALAVGAVILLCAAVDRGLTAAGFPEVSDGVAAAAAQFAFDPDDL